jgi:hypothetical protein
MGQVARVLLTRSPLTSLGYIAITAKCPFDLHVLGMPPAFVLSQDQTLKFNLDFTTLAVFSRLVVSVSQIH